MNGSTETGTLTWNANGTLKQLAVVDPFATGNTETCTNLYDDLSRLISNQCGAVWGQTFTYDVFGNIGKSGTTSFQPTYNLSNRFSVLPVGTPTYDNNGNVLTDGFHTYSWDAAGKTTQTDPGASVVSMTYDALGRWVERAAGGGFNEAVYAPDGHELALMSGQTVATAYVQLPARALARYESGGLDSYWHPDWLGTARLYSKPARTIANDVALGPFGEWYPGEGADSFFTGVAQNVMAVDSKSFPARNYHTTQGRWLSPDPAGLASVDITNPQSFNRYAYVGGNPLALTDPQGTNWFGDFWEKISGTLQSVGGWFFGTDGSGCASTFCVTGYGVADVATISTSGPGGLSLISVNGQGGGGSGKSAGNSQQARTKTATCYSLAAGQAPTESVGSWLFGANTAANMTQNWAAGVGSPNTIFSPSSVQSQEMMGAYGLSANINAFLKGGASSGNQDFGVGGLWSTGLNPTGQFVGSYQWSMSKSGGNLNIDLTNSTTAWSAFYHPNFLNSNPPTRNGWQPMGRVNQTFQITVPCS